MACRSFAESIFIYLLLNTGINHSSTSQNFTPINKNQLVLFSSLYSFITVLFVIFKIDNILNFYKLAFVPLVFFYVWHKQRNVHKNAVINYSGIRDAWYALTASIILVLVVISFNSISHMMFHTSFVLVGIYDIVHNDFILYELYKFAIMFLDVFFIFLTYKFKFIKMKDIKAMSAYKRIPITFGLCLLSMVYIGFTYNHMPPSISLYRNALLWTMALVLPSYIGFYLITAYLTRSLSLRANATADISIHIWLFNPSMFNTTSLSVYDSDVFASNFESKKLAIKKRLDKLGINDECKGYSGLVFCLFLTRLFLGLKGWNFKTDIFLQASLVIDVPAPKVRKDIENIIDQIWNTSAVETLIDGYYLPYRNSKIYDQMERPTVEQFLTDIAKSI